MYNLIISFEEESWNGRPFVLEKDRFLEYTDNDIKSEFKELSQTIIKKLQKLPTVFAYEKSLNKNPKFGLINEIITRRKEIRIKYEIIEIEDFLTIAQMEQWQFELDISRWEMNRTHWAIKNVDLTKELNAKNINFPDWVIRQNKAVDITKHKFQVAFSFPGEVRNTIEPIIEELEKKLGPDSYFYDNNYKAQLARPSLDIVLQNIYKSQSKLVVVFLCEKYQEKNWCGIEFQAIREIIFDKKHEKIMYIKMDDGKVGGVFKTDGYIDGKKHTPKEIAELIITRAQLIE